MTYNWYGSADNVAGFLFSVGTMSMMSLRHCQNCIVNGQLATLWVSLLLLLLLNLLDLLLLLLLLMDELLRLTASAVAITVATDLHLLLTEAATIGTIRRGRISKSARTANSCAAAAFVTVGRSATFPRSFWYSTITNRYTKKTSITSVISIFIRSRLVSRKIIAC